MGFSGSDGWGEGAGMGAASGAMAGAPGGPVGMVAGGVIGGIAGGLMSSKKNRPVFDQGFYEQRRREIQSFSNMLAAARNGYRNSIMSLGNDSFARFMPIAHAAFAGKGLQVNGGAYASALAKESAKTSAEMLPSVYEAERGDLTAVENQYANLFGSESAARNSQFTADANRADARMGQYGELISKGIGAGATAYGTGGGPGSSWRTSPTAMTGAPKQPYAGSFNRQPSSMYNSEFAPKPWQKTSLGLY